MAVFYLSLSSLYFVTTRWLSSASGDCKGSVLFFSWLQIKKWLNIKRVFTGLIQKTRGWLSASGHCAGPSRSWGSFLHYIRACEEWERWTQIAARCVSPTINQLSFKPNNITSLRLSLPQDYDNRSYMICCPSPQGKSNKRGCFGGKRRQTADHTEKGKILAQKNEGTRSNREIKKTNKNPHVPSASPLWSSHGTVGHKTGDERKRYFCICSPPSSAMYIGSVHPVFLTQGTDGVIFEYKMSFHLLCHKKKKNNTNKQEKKELTQKWCYLFFFYGPVVSVTSWAYFSSRI